MAHSALVRACLVWDRLTDKLNKTKTPEDRNFYLAEDFQRLQCRIEGNRAEVTVGSSPGHKVHIKIEEQPPFGTIHYHDVDNDVNEVMYKIFTDIGLNCELKRHVGVFCEGVRDDNVREVFKALAMATSMDIRISNCAALSSLKWGQCMQREFNFYKHVKLE